MDSSFTFEDYLDPISFQEDTESDTYTQFQIGNLIAAYVEGFPDLSEPELILVGTNEFRGSGTASAGSSADAIRKQFYRLYHWHPYIKVADIGNIKKGATLKDTRAALKMIIGELISAGKTVLVLGGSHDLTLAQYGAYSDRNQIIEATVIDALIDLHEEGSCPADQSFLMPMLTGQPNFIRHYNHIGFQSYFVQPRLLETLDKLRFDVFRLGTVREDMEKMEPILRSSGLLSFDMNAIRNADSPASRLSPNGFSGEEACALFRYAGMSQKLSTIGLYGYMGENDRDNLSALQAAQMLWYFIEGKALVRNEASLKDRASFDEFYISTDAFHTTFLKSKKTGRWWLSISEEEFTPCHYSDYLLASQGEMPERWLRAQERM